MMRLFSVLVLSVVCFHLFAQKTNDKQLKKSQEAYDAAMLQLRDGLVRDAVPLLGKAIEYNPAFTDAYLSLAGVYGEMKEYAKAVDYFRKAQAIDSAYSKYYLLPCSINLAAMGKFNDALAAVDTFLQIKNLGEKSIKAADYRKQCYHFAIDYAARHSNNNYV